MPLSPFLFGGVKAQSFAIKSLGGLNSAQLKRQSRSRPISSGSAQGTVPAIAGIGKVLFPQIAPNCIRPDKLPRGGRDCLKQP